MSRNILILGKKIFEIPPFSQTRPGDLGKKVHAYSLRFSALKVPMRSLLSVQSLGESGRENGVLGEYPGDVTSEIAEDDWKRGWTEQVVLFRAEKHNENA